MGECECESRSVVSDSLRRHGILQANIPETGENQYNSQYLAMTKIFKYVSLKKHMIN